MKALFLFHSREVHLLSHPDFTQPTSSGSGVIELQKLELDVGSAPSELLVSDNPPVGGAKGGGDNLGISGAPPSPWGLILMLPSCLVSSREV